MKVFKTLITLLILAALSTALIITRPSKDDFASWYIGSSETNLGILTDGVEAIINASTKEDSFLIFSVFEIEGQRYVGIADHFFGRTSISQVENFIHELTGQPGG